ncbi:MAG: hypothetical protein ABI718_17615 [Acidobacteriota bacterium]
MPSRYIAVAFLVLLPSSLFAWSPASDQRIARKAAELAPPDLRLLIQQFPTEYQRGLQSAARDEGSEWHVLFTASRRGTLDRQMSQEVAEAVALVRTRQPMNRFVEKLGVIAHLTADMNNPFNVDNSNMQLSAMKNDFESYAEAHTAVVPTVFYGITLPLDPASFINRSISRTASYYPLLAEEYFRGGVRHTSADFDDRSTAFGIMSLTYSHSVSDLVNLYYYIWQQAGGDVRSATQMRRGTLLLNESAIFSPRPPPVNPQ